MIGPPKRSPPNGVAAATPRRFWDGGFWEATNDTSGTAGAAYGYDGSAVSFGTNWLHPSRLSARSALWLRFNATRRHPHKHPGDAEPDRRGLARRMTDHCRPCGPARRERGGAARSGRGRSRPGTAPLCTSRGVRTSSYQSAQRRHSLCQQTAPSEWTIGWKSLTGLWQVIAPAVALEPSSERVTFSEVG